MNGADYEVIQVGDKILDSGKLPRGPILGIPYAPDRLPSAEEAGRAKRWAVCEQPGGKGETVQQATFVLARRDADTMDDSHRLSGGDVLYVRTRAGARHLVDAHGTSYAVTGKESDALTTALVGTRAPQPVSKEWLATLHQGDDIRFRGCRRASAHRHTCRAGSRTTRTGSAWSCGPRPARAPGTTSSCPARCGRSASSPPGCSSPRRRRPR